MQQFVTDTPGPDAEVAGAAIRSGDVEALTRAFAGRADLASARIPGFKGRTLLLIATDWPGHYPTVAASIRALLAAGADIDQAGLGEHPETPLHWAANSDDVDAINALLDGGANINAPGAVIGDGTPLNDATAFGQWNAAKLLVERGARVSAWDAAALGMIEQLRPLPTEKSVTELFWAACHGNQRETAEYLLDAGADINWIGYGDQTALAGMPTVGYRVTPV